MDNIVLNTINIKEGKEFLKIDLSNNEPKANAP